MEASRCLLSAALTRISSKILYRPGTYDTLRCRIRPASASKTHASAVTASMEPTYVSGRCRMCWCWVSFWYVCSTLPLATLVSVFSVSGISARS
eukprot:scaffold12591_cov102-Isochrysis_galbana.AAC.3